MARKPDERFLRLVAQVIARHPRGVKPASIARALGVHRSTVTRCLPYMDRIGVLLWEDEKGCLFLL
jgi:DNA-binding IclR family transcriptional regulator